MSPFRCGGSVPPSPPSLAGTGYPSQCCRRSVSSLGVLHRFGCPRGPRSLVLGPAKLRPLDDARRRRGALGATGSGTLGGVQCAVGPRISTPGAGVRKAPDARLCMAQSISAMLGMCIESTSCTACKKVFAANATGQRDSPTQDAWHVLSVSSDSDNYLLIPINPFGVLAMAQTESKTLHHLRQ